MKKLILLSLFIASFALANGETISPNMGMPIPAPGVTSGPQWASDINASLSIVDQHNHTSGQGVQVPPAGLNINSNLTFQNNQATNLKASAYTAQSSLATLDALYVKGVDLYYNDGSGNVIKLTSGGLVNATSSGISSGTASAAFSSGVLIVNADVNTPANIQAASYLMGNNVANSKYLTLQPPGAMAANYSLTFPSLPLSTMFMTLDASGNMGTSSNISAAQIAAGSITGSQLANQTITATQIANNTITRTQEAAVGQQISGSSGIYSTTSGTFTVPTNLANTITTTGRPVMLMLQSDGNSSHVSTIGCSSAGTIVNCLGQFYRCTASCGSFPTNYTGLGIQQMQALMPAAGSNNVSYPPGSFDMLDAVGAGTYTYQFAVMASIGTVTVNYVVFAAYEL